MSVNNTRRHETVNFDQIPDGDTAAGHIWALLGLRDRLACAIAAYEAHGIDGADALLSVRVSVETAIRQIAPHIYTENWTTWMNDELELCHSPQTPSDRCFLCVMKAAA